MPAFFFHLLKIAQMSRLFTFSQNERAWLRLVEIMKRTRWKYLRALPTPKPEKYYKYYLLCAFLSRDSLDTLVINKSFTHYDEDYSTLNIYSKLRSVEISRRVFLTVYDVEDLAKSCPDIKELKIDLNGTIGISTQPYMERRKVVDVPSHKLSKLTIDGPSKLCIYPLDYYLRKFPCLESFVMKGKTSIGLEQELKMYPKNN